MSTPESSVPTRYRPNPLRLHPDELIYSPADFPSGKYSVIYADPPWRFETWGRHTGNRHADSHYPVMSFRDILDLPVGDIAAENCALFLWVTQWLTPTHLRRLEEVWGFEHKTKAFSWVKLSKTGLLHWGMGTATRQGVEDCLLWTRGSKSLVVAHDVHQTVVAPVREHSRKPDEVYDRIERLTGLQAPGNKIELFSRTSRPGWDCWGLETGKFDAPAESPAVPEYQLQLL